MNRSFNDFESRAMRASERDVTRIKFRLKHYVFVTVVSAMLIAAVGYMFT